MLPQSLHPKPKSPDLSYIKPNFTAAPQSSRSWIFFTVLFVQILLLCNFHSFHSSIPRPPQNTLVHQQFIPPLNDTFDVSSSFSPVTSPVNNYAENSPDGDQCSSGKVFVYDLPRFFNKEIVENCDNLNPWSSGCDALANDGFGQRAATGLAGIVPKDLLPAWYWTDQFVTEIIFHNRMLNHKCRVMEPQSATAFYIPFYAGLAVGKYLWTNSTAQDRDRHCKMMLTWLQDQPYYKRSNGWDHFITMGRITWDFRRSKDNDWGSSCIHKLGLRNVTRLLIERNPWDYFDVGVPYPTGFHPQSDSDVIRWQNFARERKRSSLFCFAGAPRRSFKNDFRGVLLSQCRDSGESCSAVNCTGNRCSNGTSAILESFLDSDFCLQPRGDSFTRRSIFDCMIAGSIPVFFWRRTAYFQYEWFLPGEQGNYSVYIDRNAVKNGTSVKAVLESYGRDEVRKMRDKVIEYIPRLIYARNKNGLETMKDAFDVAVQAMFTRVKDQQDWSFTKW